jgi:hypothetical protein
MKKLNKYKRTPYVKEEYILWLKEQL